jgi:hypothetical protein
MDNRLTDLSYEDWIEHVFSHEVRKYQVAWYFDLDAPWWDGGPAISIAYLTRFFEDPEPALTYFADSQIAQGLHYLIDTGAGGTVLALTERTVPLSERLRCLSAIGTLFEQIFARRCTAKLSHLDETGASPLNGVCYMWWDIFPVGGPIDDPEAVAKTSPAASCHRRRPLLVAAERSAPGACRLRPSRPLRLCAVKATIFACTESCYNTMV